MLTLTVVFCVVILLHVFHVTVGQGKARATSIFDSLMSERNSILCFGDSLTHGMYVRNDGEWRLTHPYSLRLSSLINQTTPHAEVIEAGVSGESVLEMIARLPSLIDKYEPRLVIILGGTNDVFAKRQDVLSDILNIHRITHKAAIHFRITTVAVTIPSACSLDKESDKRRLEINDGIRAFHQKHVTQMLLFDLANDMKEIRDCNVKGCQNDACISNLMSPDGTHFSIKGYDLFGELLFNTIKSSNVTA